MTITDDYKQQIIILSRPTDFDDKKHGVLCISTALYKFSRQSVKLIKKNWANRWWKPFGAPFTQK